MGMDLTQPANSTRLRKDLGRDAIGLALAGKWERAAEVNRAILELFASDVDAMNRLGKALMELGRYEEAKDVLGRVVDTAPYNTIAKKNLVRLANLASTSNSKTQARKAGGAPQLFIEESGKSGTTVLCKIGNGQAIANMAPSDQVNLVVENNAIKAHSLEGAYLGQIEPKLGQRLIRLMDGGNKYDAAIVGVNDHGVSVIIRETHRDRSLRKVCSFPSKTKEEHRVYLGDSLVRFPDYEDLEEEHVIDEEDLDTEWDENE